MLHTPAGDDACCLPVFFPCLQGVRVQAVEDRDASVLIRARTATSEAPCPACGIFADRVHSRYRRILCDLAACGRQVIVDLEVRRFFCDAISCGQKIFAEQVEDLTRRHARRTSGLRGLHAAIAVALAGRAGARMAGASGVPVGRSTLLRTLRALPDPQVGQVTVLGIDDFAKKRGKSYGTVLVNMDDHRPIDLLDDRTSTALADWLKTHPGVEVICRDRAGAYADGAREGAPDATQVADRWHLWHNLGDALDKTVRAHRACLQQHFDPDATAVEGTAGEELPERPKILDSYGKERPIVARTQERYAHVQTLKATGASLNAISRELGLAFRTVQRFAAATSADELLATALNRSSKLDQFKPYLTRRWNEGCHNATQLHQELQAQGWTGSRRVVQGWIGPLRRHRKVQPEPCPPPKPRKITGWIMSHPDRLNPDDASRLNKILDRCPELAAAAGHVRSFATMMTNRDGHLLDEWIASAATTDASHLVSFATGLRRDHAAVTAGLTLPHSSGAVEGTVNKIKFLKRQMFGRANFDLLRIRVLHYR